VAAAATVAAAAAVLVVAKLVPDAVAAAFSTARFD